MNFIRKTTTLGALGLSLVLTPSLSAEGTPTPNELNSSDGERQKELREKERLGAMYKIHRDREYRAHLDQLVDDLPPVSVQWPEPAPAKPALEPSHD